MTTIRADGSVAASFPPPFTPVRLREREDAFARAVAEASNTGAGTLYYVGRFDLVEFAVVLEPEEPLGAARRAFFAGMNAMAETIAVDSPPEKPVTFDFPATLRFDGGLVGGGRLAWPEGVAESEIPDWLVFGGMLRIGGFQELGFRLSPGMTTMEEEGFDDIDPASFAASFSRHLMVEFDEWGARGFKGLGARYLSRLERQEGDGLRGIDGNGDLLVHPKAGGGAVRTDFLPRILVPAWYDAANGGPVS